MSTPDDGRLEPADDSRRAARIGRAIEDYFERRERGDIVSDRQLIQTHPDLMPELSEELDKLKLIGTARRRAESPPSSQFDESTHSDATGLPSANHGSSSGPEHKLYVRCPDCRQRIEVRSNGGLARLVCDQCGGKVRLIRDAADRHDLSDPKSIAHFQLIELLGIGSFGAVWKANDTALDRTVALKIPRQDQISSIGDERFFREARTCAQLNHPHIVSVHEVGRDGNTVYIVSDFIDGVTLSEWLTVNRPTPDEAAALCAVIAEALHHAHEAGVVHRDLKPGNIMMDRQAKPYIMDFGLAKREVDEVTMTVEGRILGTPAYMSPEQARGDGYAVDRRTDVFSLGVVLFQLLTGELPFRGNARMLILQILGDASPRPRKLSNQIPADLETITLKCMEREPTRRYPTASDVASDLLRYLRGEPVHARPIRGITRAWRWCRRKPIVAGLSAALALSLLCIAIVGPLIAIHQRNLRRDLERTLCDTYTSFGLVAGERGDHAQAVLWFAGAATKAGGDAERALANRVRLRAWSRETAIPIHALPHPNQTIRDMTFHSSGRYLKVQSADGRCTVWDLDARPPNPLEITGVPASASDWSPDGRWLALGTLEGGVSVFDMATRQSITELTQPGPVSALGFSPDGSYLAIASDLIRIWDCQSDAFSAEGFYQPATVFDAQFNDSGSQLVTAGDDGSVRLFDLSGDQGLSSPMFEVPDCAPHIRPLLLNDGTILATLSNAGDIELRDTGNGRLLTRQPGSLRGAHDVQSLRASPRRNFLVSCRFPEAQVFSVSHSESGTELRPSGTVRHLNRVIDAAFGPDSRLLLTVGIDRVAKLTALDSLSPSQPEAGVENEFPQPTSRTMVHQDEVTLATFAPTDGQFATAQADGLVRIWSTNTSGRLRVPVDTEDTYVELSRDGRYMTPSGWRAKRSLQSVQIFEVATGEPVWPRMEHDGLVNAVLFAADGREIATLSSLASNVQQREWPQVQLQSQPGWIRFWGLGSARERGAPIATPSEPVGGSYSADGKLLVVVCAGGQILLVDLAEPRSTTRLLHPGRAEVGRLPYAWTQFSADGRLFATWGLGSVVCVWDRQTKELKHRLKLHSDLCRSAAFSCDGQRLLTASDDRSVMVWNVHDGRPAAKPLKHPDWVFSACFSRDGRHVLTGCRDHMARLWDWRTGTLVCPPLEHADELFCARFLPDNRWIITSSRDRSVRVWETITGRAVTPPWPLSGYGHQLRVTSDGRFAVVAGVMPTLNVFGLEDLMDRVPARTELDADAFRLLGEVLSGRGIHRGGGTFNLTSAQWLDRWHEYRARVGTNATRLFGFEASP